MINQARFDATDKLRLRQQERTQAAPTSMLAGGAYGSFLGAGLSGTVFAAISPLLESGQALSPAHLLVYVVSGLWLGAVSGGIMGSLWGAMKAPQGSG